MSIQATTPLTERQQREREYYEEYCRTHDSVPVNFAAVKGDEHRPWNPYWYSFQVAQDHFNSPDQRLLDFGCGTGQTSICMAEVGYRVSGFDICDSQVKACEQRAAHYGFAERTDFTTQAAENLDYEDKTFDCIMGIDILHHIEIEESIREVHRVLKDDGVAIFKEWVEVPVFDRVRESRLVRAVFSKEMSLDTHITHDERKLSGDDISLIRDYFPAGGTKRFGVSSRIRRIMPKKGLGPCRFERFDHWLTEVIPPVRSIGGEIVLVLRK